MGCSVSKITTRCACCGVRGHYYSSCKKLGDGKQFCTRCGERKDEKVFSPSARISNPNRGTRGPECPECRRARLKRERGVTDAHWKGRRLAPRKPKDWIDGGRPKRERGTTEAEQYREWDEAQRWMRDYNFRKANLQGGTSP